MKLLKFLLSSSFLLVGSFAFADGQYYNARQQGSYQGQQNPVHHMYDDATGAHQGGHYSSDSYYQQNPQQYSNDPGYHIDQYGNKVYHDQRAHQMQQGQYPQGQNVYYQR